jgi:hypothetical protein
LDFAGGEITSEAGLVLLREFDERLKLTASLKGLVVDQRDRRYIEHPTLNLLRQRIYQIAAGYEDANDATFLRHDPTLRAVAGRGEVPLASQPTLSRLENAVPWESIRALERLVPGPGVVHPAVGRKGSADRKSFWTSIRLLIRPTGSSS